jgi:hypothetical protein
MPTRLRDFTRLPRRFQVDQFRRSRGNPRVSLARARSVRSALTLRVRGPGVNRCRATYEKPWCAGLSCAIAAVGTGVHDGTMRALRAPGNPLEAPHPDMFSTRPTIGGTDDRAPAVLAEEVAEDHADGIITRREALRRLASTRAGAAEGGPRPDQPSCSNA